jgi:hypothetical protein
MCRLPNDARTVSESVRADSRAFKRSRAGAPELGQATQTGLRLRIERLAVRLNCKTLQTNQSIKMRNSRDVNRDGMKNPASDVETSVALEAKPSAPKTVYLLSL